MDVIRQLRNRLKIKKMGHAGTLDPAATGLMLIGVGDGTKQLNDFLKLDKEYLAEVLIGTKTASGDLDGPILSMVPVTELNETKVQKAVDSLVGTLTLPVSAYSAIKKDGVPMYKRAHAAEKKGEVVADVPEREMTVRTAELLGVSQDDESAILTVRFTVGSGTYIRSLAEEIGRLLGYPACLKSLRRTKIGVFDVTHAKKIEEV